LASLYGEFATVRPAASSRWNVGATGPQILEPRIAAGSSTKLKMTGIANPLMRRDSLRLG
jgi:hypothetical protein